MNATTRNLIVAITDLNGRVYQTCSAGIIGYKNSKKNTKNY